MLGFLRSLSPAATQKRLIDYGRRSLNSFEHLSTQVRAKLSHLPTTNFDLGVSHFKRGNLTDAIMRFKIVIWMEPEHANAHLYLAQAYFSQEKKDKAIEAIAKAEILNSSLEGLSYWKSLITNPDSITHIPPSVMQERVDHTLPLPHQEEEIAQIISRQLLLSIHDKNPNLVVFEEGAGQGLCGKSLKERDVIASLISLENQPKTAAKLKKLHLHGAPVYDEVITDNDALDIVKKHGKFDVIIINELLLQYGPLDDILPELTANLTANGRLVMIARAHHTLPYELTIKDHVFAHSKKYLNEQCEKIGLHVISTHSLGRNTHEKIIFLCSNESKTASAKKASSGTKEKSKKPTQKTKTVKTTVKKAAPKKTAKKD